MSTAVFTNKELSADLATTATHWFAVRAKTTHEKRVAALFERKGYEWFLPQYQARRRWSDRVKQVELPLFPGYVFCRFVSEERIAILTTPSVLGIAGIGKDPLPVDESEIEAIRRVLDKGFGLKPEPFLEVGRRVRINGGSLEGVEGMIESIRHKDRLILSVTLLQRSVSVDIDSAWVTVLPKSSREKACPTPLWSSASYCRP
jgi:transcription antitermination factor NusG